MIRQFLIAAVILTGAALPFAAQKLPNEIRGYKVYAAQTRERFPTRNSAQPVALRRSKLIAVTPLGVTFEAEMNIENVQQNGRVDFLSFYNFRVDGVPVEIEEYVTPFTIAKNTSVILPKPVRIFLSTSALAQAVWAEMRNSRQEWRVSGRIFVFGRFKKYRMTFKRVVPIDVSFTIKNPVR